MQRPNPKPANPFSAMFVRLLRRDGQTEAIASSLYGAIVAQARLPVLYEKYGVSDTIDGRFEMLLLHLVLVLDRLSRGGVEERALAQRVFDLHGSRMDGTLREMGVGDLSVPKRMKKMTQAFYGRAGAYREALASFDVDALAAAIARNVFAGVVAPAGALPLAAYMASAARDLAAQNIMAGASFPDPAAFAPEAT